MRFFTLAEALQEKGLCLQTNSLNTTMLYFYKWKSGEIFDFKKTSVAMHRARLRKVGIDIRQPYRRSSLPKGLLVDDPELSQFLMNYNDI